MDKSNQDKQTSGTNADIRVLRRAIEKAVPWNSLRMAKRNISMALRIPNARGNPTTGFPLSIAEDHSDPDGELRQTFLGAIRLDLSDGNLDYPEADEDSARLATLTERLVVHRHRLREEVLDMLPHRPADPLA